MFFNCYCSFRGVVTLLEDSDIRTLKMPTLDKTLIQEWPPMAHL